MMLMLRDSRLMVPILSRCWLETSAESSTLLFLDLILLAGDLLFDIATIIIALLLHQFRNAFDVLTCPTSITSTLLQLVAAASPGVATGHHLALHYSTYPSNSIASSMFITLPPPLLALSLCALRID